VIAFVIMRDRVTYAQRCVQALLDADLQVVVVDHDSRWEDAVYWLADLPELTTGVRVWSERDNPHPRDLWRWGGPVAECVPPGERFIVTDCDVVPDEACPPDWPAYLGALLDEHPNAVKAGLALRTDDLPEHFADRSKVEEWESAYQPPIAHPVGSWSAVWADIDTTLAMYRAPGRFRLGPAIRTTAPYMARHLPWYEDSANLSEELRFYAARAEYGHWRSPEGFQDNHGLRSDNE